MIRAVIDRFEGAQAVLLVGEEDRKAVFPRKYLPEALREGDHVNIAIRFDAAATESARREAEALLEAVKRQKS